MALGNWSRPIIFAVCLTVMVTIQATMGTDAEVGFLTDAVTLVLRGHEVTRVKAVSEAPGRVHFTIASNPPFAERKAFQTRVREAYKEAHEYLHAPGGLLSYPARVGTVRCRGGTTECRGGRCGIGVLENASLWEW